MSKYILKKAGIPDALNALRSASVVYIPVKNKRGLVEYRELGKDASAADAKLDCRPDIPPKGILFPQTELLLTFKKEGGKITVMPAKPDDREKVIFGARPCDAIAIAHLDRVFCGGKFTDSYYKARREKVTVLTIACDGPADATCFCSSTGGSPAATSAAT